LLLSNEGRAETGRAGIERDSLGGTGSFLVIESTDWIRGTSEGLTKALGIADEAENTAGDALVKTEGFGTNDAGFAGVECAEEGGGRPAMKSSLFLHF
jgi:hypothetical protein